MIFFHEISVNQNDFGNTPSQPEAVPNGLDAIIVGSGIGGLTTASLMAKAGKKVLVLEKHGRAGGCTHTFASRGFEFDIGERFFSASIGFGRLSFSSLYIKI